MKSLLNNLFGDASRRISSLLMTGIVCLGWTGSGGAVDLMPGDIVVADGNGGSPGQVVWVDPVSGEQLLISSGNLLDSPFSIAVEPMGTLVVADLEYDTPEPRKVIRIDPVNGAQMIVTEGDLLYEPRGITISPAGDILVADAGSPSNMGYVISVDPLTGDQSLLFEGGYLNRPWDLAFDGDGNLYVACEGPGSTVAVVRVAPDGGQTLVSPGGPYASWTGGIVVYPSGEIFTSEIYYNNAIIEIDPLTGNQSILVQYGPFEDPRDLAIDDFGSLVVADENVSAPGKVIRVDPETGAAVVLSDGGLLVDPYGIAVVPELAPDIIEVVIDVMPGSDTNPINLKSKGRLPVAILSTEEFHALDVDPDTVLFGDPTAESGLSPERAVASDVNGDGLSDLLLFFSTHDLVEAGALNEETTMVLLVGMTWDGDAIEGREAVRIVPGSSQGRGAP